MKKRALLFLLPFVASCGSPIVFRAYQNPEISTSYPSKKGEGFETLSEYAPIAIQGGNLPTSYSSISNNGSRFSLPSLGRQKLLVIPMDFQEYPGEAEEIEAISQTFFGQNDADAFPSVAEYFDRSSYSHFQLEGRVAPSWFRSSQYSYSDLSSIYGSKRTEQALQKLYLEALNWYDAAFPDMPSSQYAYSDGHGHEVVPVYFIYRAPYAADKNRSSMFWAFSISAPAPISWSSYSMLRTSKGEDSHTLIHEMGHLLGFPDLYDANDSVSSGQISPCGHGDMMDGSLGDENPFFKLLMGWTKPIVVRGKGEVTLHQFVSSGDCLLLKSHYSDSLFDEYVLLDFYTPSSLNGFDANQRKGVLNRMVRKSGVRAYRVDARLGLFSSSGASELLTFNSDLTGKQIGFYASNSQGYESNGYIEGANPLLQWLDASSSSSKLRSYFVASDANKTVQQNGYEYQCRDVLFQRGQGFEGDAFSDLRSSNGSVGFSWKVEEVGSTFARVSFQPIP